MKRTKGIGGQVIVVSGTHTEDLFDFGGSIRRIPAVTHDGGEGLTAAGDPYKRGTPYHNQRKEAILAILRELRPDVVVFEHYPLVRYPYRDLDLEALVEYRAESRTRVPFVTIARDSATVDDKKRELLRSFDYVLVRGWKGIVWGHGKGTTQELASIVPKPEYLGHILADIPSSAVPDSPDKGSVIVFSSGGYEDCDELFFHKAIESREHSNFAHHPWKIVVPVDCPKEVFQALVDKVHVANEAAQGMYGEISVVRTYRSEDFSKDQNACSAAIVRGSYNTTLELAARQKPFVVVPRTVETVAWEHSSRAEFLEREGICTKISEQEIAVVDGARLLALKLDQSATLPGARNLEFQDGRQFAARLMQIAMQPELSILTRQLVKRVKRSVQQFPLKRGVR